MLYQTNHFSFNLHSIPPLSAPSSSLFSSSSSPTLEIQGMETALKSSIRKEMSLKSSQQAFFDDFLVVNSQNGVSCDDFSVDDLLDLSNEDGFVEKTEKEQELQTEEKHVQTFVPSIQQREDEINSDRGADYVAGEDFGSVLAGELAVPADDLENLEWLSHFVEDSFSEPYLVGVLPEKPKWLTGNRNEPVKRETDKPVFKTPVPAKSRSKRTRTGGRVWSLGSPSFTESSASSTSSSNSSPSNSNCWLISDPFQTKPQAKKQKKKKKSPCAVAVSCAIQLPRRCSHCGVQKTPQWRAGPMGAKTLCNACGVRFKSGRLLPEYRPACSPTFSSTLHSNHHRKVLEMRRKKDDVEPGLNLPVQSF